MLKITMPKAGQSMEEGTVVRWRKTEGQSVTKGEVLLEVETDKATVEVEAAAGGTLRKILCPEGVTVPVLVPIALLGAPDEDMAATLAEAEAEIKAALEAAASAAPKEAAAGAQAAPEVEAPPGPVAITAPPIAGDGRVKASPAARKLARERGIDLASLGIGRGPYGRILSTDVLAGGTAAGEAIRRPMTKMRRAIAAGLLASKQTIPHFYMKLTICAEPLVAAYRREKEKYPCSINDVIALACARVIREFPAFRSRIEGNQIVEFRSVNIGIAVGVEDGLVVPVLMNADRLSLQELAKETRRIIEAARAGKLEGAGKGVFTISNLGMFGIEEFTAIINPPEAAILAVGAVRDEILVTGRAFRPAKAMTMTLSGDHRVVDGVVTAKFLARLKEILEAPSQLIPPGPRPVP